MSRVLILELRERSTPRATKDLNSRNVIRYRERDIRESFLAFDPRRSRPVTYLHRLSGPISL